MGFLILTAKDVVLWIIWFPLRSIVRYLPIMFLYGVADIVAPLYFLFAKARRDLLAEEIGKLYGDRLNQKELRKVIRRSFSIHAKRQVENLLFGQLTQDKLDKIVSVEGYDHLQAALENKKGVILLLAHFGSFLLPLPVLGYKGYKVMQVGGKPLVEGTRPIYKKIFQLRKRETDTMPFRFSLTNQYLGPIIRALNNNEIVVIAFDGRTGNKWFPVPFISRTAQFSPGPFNLAIKTGAAIIPTFVVRGKDNKHTITFEPSMQLEIASDKEETLKMNTLRFAGIFERYLLQYPCHFAMILYSVRREALSGLNRPLFID
jgi:lauroyl/myristoyl acyltransferase